MAKKYSYSSKEVINDPSIVDDCDGIYLMITEHWGDEKNFINAINLLAQKGWRCVASYGTSNLGFQATAIMEKSTKPMK